MYRLFHLPIFAWLIVSIASPATADYRIKNQTAQDVWVTYAAWQPRQPEGWRTWGWYKIKPRATQNLEIPKDRIWVYIRVRDRDNSTIKPPDHTTRERASFLIHPLKSFSVLQTAGGDFIRSNRAQGGLEGAEFYKYRNGGSHTITNVLKQETSLAAKVFNKHSKTLERKDIQAVLPSVFESLKDPKTQRFLNATTINLVVSNPNLLKQFVPDIDPKFVTLLKRDAKLRSMLRDPLVQALLQKPAAIDELAALLRIGEPGLDVTPKRDPPAPKKLPDLPAQQIYNRAIHSLVWIRTVEGNSIGKGSGVLIDKRRKLVATNQHVTHAAKWVDVFFPWRDRNGRLNKQQDFYEKNEQRLKGQGYATQGRVIAKSVRNDLAIIQLIGIPTTAREIQHDFGKNVEDNIKRGDSVHILGNPGDRLWKRTQGTFIQKCLLDGAACLQIKANTEPGNSGGPVLNARGVLVGILTAGKDETLSVAIPARSLKALLNTVPANVVTLPPKQTYPKQVFKIRNTTGVKVPYQIRWSNADDWQPKTLQTGFIRTHWSNGQHVPQGYPKIRFDHIAGDQQVTYRSYTLETTLFRENNNQAPTYRFRYNLRDDRLDLVRDALAAPALSREVPKQTQLLSNYPNPFNPETWIPYHLAAPAEVSLSIYDVKGLLVRKLTLGHQPAGVYQSKVRAAYWDGRNELGESVASGVYFYTLTASEFTATQKMLIRK